MPAIQNTIGKVVQGSKFRDLIPLIDQLKDIVSDKKVKRAVSIK